MKADQYVTVAREGVHESEINRSRFLCSLAPAATEQEAQDFVARIRKEHPTASHNCFAYVVRADACDKNPHGD
ncbi:YigZ family protein, partial [Streptomyces sp. NPDC059552]|uniref:YigZ family protein n=1 Tax=Streptomyces sp. NPDC059552 TaxID=3346862 RepID=UPI0036B3C05C